MNRIQFLVLTILSGIVLLLIIGNLMLSHKVGMQQTQVAQVQQALQEGQGIQGNLRQLALRLYADAQKTGDQGLKDLLTRQQISFKPGETNSGEAIPPAPSSSSTSK